MITFVYSVIFMTIMLYYLFFIFSLDIFVYLRQNDRYINFWKLGVYTHFKPSRRTGRAGIIEAAFVKASRLDVQRCGRRRRNKIWIQYAFKHHGYRSWRRAFVAVSCWRRVYLLVLLDIFDLDVLKCSRPYGRFFRRWTSIT